MFDIDKSLKKMLGKPKGKGKDFDGDGVPNWKDCQPRNTMRQDKIKDWNGKSVGAGDTIEDENGNKGKVKWVKDDRALVNFGKTIGDDMVYDRGKFAKGGW